MATTIQDLKRWFKEGKEQGATHMVVVCDTFDWEDYPVYVKDPDEVLEVIRKHSMNMQKVMEVYNLNMTFAEQSRPGTRVFNY
jgi:hypothetical protein